MREKEEEMGNVAGAEDGAWVGEGGGEERGDGKWEEEEMGLGMGAACRASLEGLLWEVGQARAALGAWAGGLKGRPASAPGPAAGPAGGASDCAGPEAHVHQDQGSDSRSLPNSRARPAPPPLSRTVVQLRAALIARGRHLAALSLRLQRLQRRGEAARAARAARQEALQALG